MCPRKVVFLKQTIGDNGCRGVGCVPVTGLLLACCWSALACRATGQEIRMDAKFTLGLDSTSAWSHQEGNQAQ